MIIKSRLLILVILAVTVNFVISPVTSYPLAIMEDACNQTLFPISPFLSPINTTPHWPIGFVGTMSQNASTRMSIMKFAAQYVNSLTDLLPTIAIDIYAASVAGSRTKALLASMQLIQNIEVRSIVGSYNDSEADATAILANEFEIPQVASVVQSTAFSDINTYPYFLRVIPSYAAQGDLVAAIMKKFNWKQSLLLTTADSYGTEVSDYLRAAGVNFTQLFISSSGSDHYARLPIVQSYMETTKLVLMFCSSVAGFNFMRILYDHGLVSSSTVYIISQPMTQLVVDDVNAFRNYSYLLDGAIGLLPYGGEGSEHTKISRLWNEADKNEFPRTNRSYSKLWYEFEAVYAQAVVLDTLVKSYPLEEITGKLFFETIIRSRYVGVTGDVFFDSRGDRCGNWTVINFVNDTIYRKAKYIYGQPVLLEYKSFTFFGNSDAVPVDYIRGDVPDTIRGIGIYLGLGVVLGVCLVFTLVTLVILIWNWKEFQRHGPFYCCIIIFGVITSYLAAGALLLEPTPSLCMAFVWLHIIAFDLVYGCLFIKTLVLYRVFRQANKFKSTTLSPYHILKMLLAFISIDTILLLIWTFSNHPGVHTVRLLDYYEEEECNYYNNVFWYIFVVLKAGWLLFGAVLSFITRAIARAYNESKSIGYAIYHNMIILTIGFALGAAIRSVPGGVTIVATCVTAEIYTFTLIILFVPIWYSLFWAPHDQVFAMSKVRRPPSSPPPPSPSLSSPLPITESPSFILRRSSSAPLSSTQRPSLSPCSSSSSIVSSTSTLPETASSSAPPATTIDLPE